MIQTRHFTHTRLLWGIRCERDCSSHIDTAFNGAVTPFKEMQWRVVHHILFCQAEGGLVEMNLDRSDLGETLEFRQRCQLVGYKVAMRTPSYEAAQSAFLQRYGAMLKGDVPLVERTFFHSPYLTRLPFSSKWNIGDFQGCFSAYFPVKYLLASQLSAHERAEWGREYRLDWSRVFEDWH